MNLNEKLTNHALPLLDGPDLTACALVFQAHASADWEVWGKRALRYWSAFEENVKLGTYRGETLADWWEHMRIKMGVTTPVVNDRSALAILLGTTPAQPVLDALYQRAGTFVLYQRVISDTKKAERVAAQQPLEPFDDETETLPLAQGALL
jgi:hypothetical protein